MQEPPWQCIRRSLDSRFDCVRLAYTGRVSVCTKYTQSSHQQNRRKGWTAGVHVELLTWQSITLSAVIVSMHNFSRIGSLSSLSMRMSRGLSQNNIIMNIGYLWTKRADDSGITEDHQSQWHQVRQKECDKSKRLLYGIALVQNKLRTSPIHNIRCADGESCLKSRNDGPDECHCSIHVALLGTELQNTQKVIVHSINVPITSNYDAFPLSPFYCWSTFTEVNDTSRNNMFL